MSTPLAIEGCGYRTTGGQHAPAPAPGLPRPENAANSAGIPLALAIITPDHPDTLHTLALLADWSYLPYQHLQFAASAHHLIVQRIEDTRTDTQVDIWAIGQNLVIVPRGTSSVRDALNDVRIHLDHDTPAGIGVHRGFRDCANAVWDRVLDILTAHPTAFVWFAGHSLGGAIAVLLAARYAALFAPRPAIKLIACVTFGQPRVGDFRWARRAALMLSGKYFRIVHDLDIVPRLPWLLGIYRHAGTELFFDAAGRCHTNPGPLHKLRDTLAFTPRRLCTRLDNLLTDHRMDSYVAITRRLASHSSH